jgi:hypothetical protein
MNNWTQNSMPLECHTLNRTIIGLKGVCCRFRTMNGSTFKSTYNRIKGQGLIELRGHGRGLNRIMIDLKLLAIWQPDCLLGLELSATVYVATH